MRLSCKYSVERVRVVLASNDRMTWLLHSAQIQIPFPLWPLIFPQLHSNVSTSRAHGTFPARWTIPWSIPIEIDLRRCPEEQELGIVYSLPQLIFTNCHLSSRHPHAIISHIDILYHSDLSRCHSPRRIFYDLLNDPPNRHLQPNHIPARDHDSIYMITASCNSSRLSHIVTNGGKQQCKFDMCR